MDTEIIEIIAYISIAIFLIALWIISTIRKVKQNSVRENAEKKLEEYLKNNTVQIELKNKYLELRLIEKVFYCKERTNGKKEGRFFYVSGNTDHVLTAWGLINAIFTQNTKYNDVRKFYLNIGTEEIVDTGFEFVDDFDAEMNMLLPRNSIERTVTREMAHRRASRRYFHENNIGNQPDFIMNEAQNEYCRLSLENDNGNFYLVCKEIWGYRNFIIQCQYPEQILQEFKLKQNKMETYNELIKRFKYEDGLTIILPNEGKEKPVQKNVTEIDETQEISYNNENKIEKTDERSIDL